MDESDEDQEELDVVADTSLHSEIENQDNPLDSSISDTEIQTDQTRPTFQVEAQIHNLTSLYHINRLE